MDEKNKNEFTTMLWNDTELRRPFSELLLKLVSPEELDIILAATDKFARLKWQQACEATRESMISEDGTMPEYR